MKDWRTAVSFWAFPISNLSRLSEIWMTASIIGIATISFYAFLAGVLAERIFDGLFGVRIVLLGIIIAFVMFIFILDANLFFRYLGRWNYAILLTVLEVTVFTAIGGLLYILEMNSLSVTPLPQADSALEVALLISGVAIGLLIVARQYRAEIYANEVKPFMAQRTAILNHNRGLTFSSIPLVSHIYGILNRKSGSERTFRQQQYFGNDFTYGIFESKKLVWDEEAVEQVEQQWDTDSLSLVEGPSGSGKTSFLHYIAFKTMAKRQVFFLRMQEDLQEESITIDEFTKSIKNNALDGAVVVIDDIHIAPIEAELLVYNLMNLPVDTKVVLGSRLNFLSYRWEAKAGITTSVSIPSIIKERFFEDQDEELESNGTMMEWTSQFAGTPEHEGTSNDRGTSDLFQLTPIDIRLYHRSTMEALIEASIQNKRLRVDGDSTAERALIQQFSVYFSFQASLTLADKVLRELEDNSPVEAGLNLLDIDGLAQENLQQTLQDYWDRHSRLEGDNAQAHANRFKTLLLSWLLWGNFESPVNTSLVSCVLNIEKRRARELLNDLQSFGILQQIGEEEKDELYRSTHHPIYNNRLLMTLTTDDEALNWFDVAFTTEEKNLVLKNRLLQLIAGCQDNFTSSMIRRIGMHAYGVAYSPFGQAVSKRGVGALPRQQGVLVVDALTVLADSYGRLRSTELFNSNFEKLSHSLWAVFAVRMMDFDLSGTILDETVTTLVTRCTEDFITLVDDGQEASLPVLKRGLRGLTLGESLDVLLGDLDDDLQQEFAERILELGHSSNTEFFISFAEFVTSTQRFNLFWEALSAEDQESLYWLFLDNLVDDEAVFRGESISVYNTKRIFETFWEFKPEQQELLSTRLLDRLNDESVQVKSNALELMKADHIFDYLPVDEEESDYETVTQTVLHTLINEDLNHWYDAASLMRDTDRFEFFWESWTDQEHRNIVTLTLARLDDEEPESCGPATLFFSNEQFFTEAIEIINDISVISGLLLDNLGHPNSKVRADTWNVFTNETIFSHLWGSFNDFERAKFTKHILESLRAPNPRIKEKTIEVIQKSNSLSDIMQDLSQEEKIKFKNSFSKILGFPDDARRELISLFRSRETCEIIVGPDRIYTEEEFAEQLFKILSEEEVRPFDILYTFASDEQFFSLLDHLIEQSSDSDDMLNSDWKVSIAFECCWGTLSRDKRIKLLTMLLNALRVPDTQLQADICRTFVHPDVLQKIFTTANQNQKNKLLDTVLAFLQSNGRKQAVVLELLTPQSNFDLIWSHLTQPNQFSLVGEIVKLIDIKPSESLESKSVPTVMATLVLSNEHFFHTVYSIGPDTKGIVRSFLLSCIQSDDGPFKTAAFLVLSQCDIIGTVWSDLSRAQKESIANEAVRLYEAELDDEYLSKIVDVFAEKPCVKEYIEPILSNDS